jgi:hypothetical protein
MTNVSDELRSQSARLQSALFTELLARVTEARGRHCPRDLSDRVISVT